MTLEEGEMSRHLIISLWFFTFVISTDKIMIKYLAWTFARCLGEFYNVPVTAEGEDLAANLKKLRVRKL